MNSGDKRRFDRSLWPVCTLNYILLSFFVLEEPECLERMPVACEQLEGNIIQVSRIAYGLGPAL